MKTSRVRFALLAFAGGAVLAWMTWHSRTDIIRLLHGASSGWLIAAVLAGVALNAVYGLLFDRILCKYSGAPHPLLNTSVFLMSQPGKYVPGKLWQAVLQSIVLGRRTRLAAVAVANIELSLVAVAHATGLGIALLFGPTSILAVATVLATLAVCHVLAGTSFIRRLLTALPRLRNWLAPADGCTSIDSSNPLPILLLNVAAMATNAIASWCLLLAANTALSTLQLQHLLASLWLGIAASLLAIPVPAGLGIREAAMAGFGAALARDVPTTLLISIALLARCWQLLLDVASVAIGWLIFRCTSRTATT